MTWFKMCLIFVDSWRCMLGGSSPAELHFDLACSFETSCFSVTGCACVRVCQPATVCLMSCVTSSLRAWWPHSCPTSASASSHEEQQVPDREQAAAGAAGEKRHAGDAGCYRQRGLLALHPALLEAAEQWGQCEHKTRAGGGWTEVWPTLQRDPMT